MKKRILTVLTAVVLSACGGGASTTSPSLSAVLQPSPAPLALRWIVSETSMAKLEGSSLGVQNTQILFDTPRTYEIMNALGKADPLPAAKHVAYYRDETLMASDLAAGKLASVDGALYDDEAYDEPGNTTPADQIANPVSYAQNAAQVLHGAGKTFVYTIGSEVGPAGQFWTTTLPSVAPYPDAIDFQTQAAEGTSSFAQQVAQYSSVFRANGRGAMLVGIAVAPKGQSKTAADITSAYAEGLANRPPVDGFWFDIAVRSPSCTGCLPSPDLTPGVEFLLTLLPK